MFIIGTISHRGTKLWYAGTNPVNGWHRMTPTTDAAFVFSTEQAARQAMKDTGCHLITKL